MKKSIDWLPQKRGICSVVSHNVCGGRFILQRIQQVHVDSYVAVCDTTITLTATWVGDSTHHTMLWEQISGATDGVEYISTLDGPSLTYVNHVPPGQFDDKLFRFWFDKGTLEQVHYDVWVFGSPTVESFCTSYSQTAQMGYGTDFIQCRVPSLHFLVGFPSTVTGSSTANFNVADTMVLEWNVLCDNELITQILIQKYVGSSWVTVGVLNDGTATMYTSGITANSKYRIIAVYDEYGLGLESYISNEIYTALAPNAEKVFVTSQTEGTFYSSIASGTNKLTGYSFTPLTAKAYDPTPVNAYGSFFTQKQDTTAKITNYVLNIPVLKTVSYLDFGTVDGYSGFYTQVNDATNKITNYTVNIPGGSHIGG